MFACQRQKEIEHRSLSSLGKRAFSSHRRLACGGRGRHMNRKSRQKNGFLFLTNPLSLIALLLVIFTTGCGGGGGGGGAAAGGAPAPAVPGQITGTVMAPPLVNLSANRQASENSRAASANGLVTKSGVLVSAFLIDDNGNTVGVALATTTTDANGKFLLSLPNGVLPRTDLVLSVGTGNVRMRALTISNSVVIDPATEKVVRDAVSSEKLLSQFIKEEIEVAVQAARAMLATSDVEQAESVAALIKTSFPTEENIITGEGGDADPKDLIPVEMEVTPVSAELAPRDFDASRSSAVFTVKFLNAKSNVVDPQEVIISIKLSAEIGTVSVPQINGDAWGFQYDAPADIDTSTKNLTMTVSSDAGFSEKISLTIKKSIIPIFPSSLALGNAHSCFLKNKSVSCVGSNGSSQLGFEGSSITALKEVVGLNEEVVSVAAGFESTCALLATGAAMCWGGNINGQLGLGFESQSVSSPQRMVIDGDLIVKLSLGSEDDSAHGCSLTKSGKIYCFGNNYFGQLGDGTNNNAKKPVKVSASETFVDLCVGGQFSCALNQVGGAFCWGYNGGGQLGDNTNTDRSKPVAVAGLSQAKSIFCSHTNIYASHACAVKKDGKAMCWGSNSEGQLAPKEDDAKFRYNIPVEVSSSKTIEAMSLGDQFSCALHSDKTVSCWGLNDKGQLGIGSKENQDFPVSVQNINNVENLQAGINHACVKLAGGGVSCWGENLYGELGNGVSGDSLVPVQVKGMP